MVSADILATTLLSLTEESHDIDATLNRFVAYLRAHDVLPLLPDIIRILERRARIAAAHPDLSIETAHQVSPELLDAIASYVGAERSPRTHVGINPDLIAGFKVRYEDMEYDASAKTQLFRLKQVLMK